jgi:G3E family GTPase
VILTLHDLDTMVTVIDCHNFWKDLKSIQLLKERGEAAGPSDERTIVDLLLDQVEFANVIVLNKVTSYSSPLWLLRVLLTLGFRLT